MSDLDAPPPSYSDAIKVRNGIPPAIRRSMEDETRPLPAGWVRQYDVEHGHQYFVDTRADPPTSIWHHPYDDRDYLSSLDPKERERVQNLYKSPSHADIEAESTDEEGHTDKKSTKHAPLGSLPTTAGASSATSTQTGEKSGVGRRLKDKLTNSTHEERAKRRKEREVEERGAYEAHLAARRAMHRALETGEPQLVGKDRDGHDVYIEPPQGPGNSPYGAQNQGRGRNYGAFNGGPYANPNARFIRPQQTYGRPYGGGYGGGLGLPLAAGLGGGLLLGGLYGGGMGGMGMGGMGMGGMGMGGMGMGGMGL